MSIYEERRDETPPVKRRVAARNTREGTAEEIMYSGGYAVTPTTTLQRGTRAARRVQATWSAEKRVAQSEQ